VEKFAAALVDAQVDLNPHQVDAALFSFTSVAATDETGSAFYDSVDFGSHVI